MPSFVPGVSAHCNLLDLLKCSVYVCVCGGGNTSVLIPLFTIVLAILSLLFIVTVTPINYSKCSVFQIARYRLRSQPFPELLTGKKIPIDVTLSLSQILSSNVPKFVATSCDWSSVMLTALTCIQVKFTLTRIL